MKVSSTRQALLALAPLVLASHRAGAQTAADPLGCKAVSIVAPFPAGSTTDTIARALGPRLATELGQAVVVAGLAPAVLADCGSRKRMN